MTLAENLLPSLAEHRPASPGRHTWTYTDAATGWAVALTIDKVDAMSCQLTEVALTPATPAAWDAPALRARAETVATKVTGLLEQLRLIEIDALRGEAILRSTAPTSRSKKRFHYEMRISGTGTASLRRYQAALDPVAKREPVAFGLTHEALGKFLDDVTNSLA
jgi:hypothetical protein